LAASTVLLYCAIAMSARMTRIEMTIISSSSVKPRALRE
jgi:hypothetical protein